jgi:hypothetical protein
MVISHLGVFNDGDDPVAAIKKLMQWSQGVGEYFAGEKEKDRIAALTAQVEQAAQPVAQGPIGYMNAGHVYELQQRRIHYGYVYPKEGTGAEIPVYTSPPKAALTDEQIEKAAKVLSHCMDYPWEYMPEAGRLNMRKNARTVIEAARITQATVEKEGE